MQHLDVNFGGIWRFKLGFLYLLFSVVFLLNKYALIFKSPVATLTLFSLKNSEGRSAPNIRVWPKTRPGPARPVGLKCGLARPKTWPVRTHRIT